jgi:hypothetical protein
MKADQHSSTIYKGPTTRERIEALAEHSPFFEHTAQHPQTVIHERFPEPWTMIIAYVEGEVHRCYDAANEFIWKNSGNVAEEDEEETLSADFSNTMDNLGDVLLRHGMQPSLKIVIRFPSDCNDSKRSQCFESDGDGTVSLNEVHERLPCPVWLS